MLGDKSPECSVNNAEIRLIKYNTQDFDECQLGYKQDNTGVVVLFY